MRTAMDNGKVDVTATLSVQYMYKHLKTDMPSMSDVAKCSVTVQVDCPTDLMPYIPTYVENMTSTDAVAAEDAGKQKSYCAPKELVAKWRKWLKKHDGSFGKMIDDQVIEFSISCTIEDAVRDIIEERWDNGMSDELGVPPHVPADHRLGAHFVHLIGWEPVAVGSGDDK